MRAPRGCGEVTLEGGRLEEGEGDRETRRQEGSSLVGGGRREERDVVLA